MERSGRRQVRPDTEPRAHWAQRQAQPKSPLRGAQSLPAARAGARGPGLSARAGVAGSRRGAEAAVTRSPADRYRHALVQRTNMDCSITGAGVARGTTSFEAQTLLLRSQRPPKPPALPHSLTTILELRRRARICLVASTTMSGCKTLTSPGVHTGTQLSIPAQEPGLAALGLLGM